MTDFNAPTNSTTYSSVLTYLNAKIQSCAKMDFSSDTSIPTGTIRYDTSTARFGRYNGSTWDVLGGLVDNLTFSSATSAINTTSTSFTDTGLSVAVTTLAGETVKVSFGMNFSVSSAAYGYATISDGADKTPAPLWYVTTTDTGGLSQPLTGMFTFSPGATTTTFKLRYKTSGGTIYSSQRWMLIEVI
jgi:hypothetical protein